jgi:hypothetical protein
MASNNEIQLVDKLKNLKLINAKASNNETQLVDKLRNLNLINANKFSGYNGRMCDKQKREDAVCRCYRRKSDKALKIDFYLLEVPEVKLNSN